MITLKSYWLKHPRIHTDGSLLPMWGFHCYLILIYVGGCTNHPYIVLFTQAGQINFNFGC